jgi:paraquat-inducible protein B
MDMLVKVTMEVLPGSFELLANGAKLTEAARSTMTPQQYVDAGIRAKLGTESLVTGQLLVELDFRPDLPAVFRAREKGGPPEIPTIPGDVQQVLERLQTFFTQVSEQIDGPTLAKNVQGILNG